MISDADSNSEPTRTDTSPSPGNGRLRFVDGDSEIRMAPDGDALFLDVDGTLLEIAHHPDAVSVPPPLVTALDRMARRFGGALALISGRSIANLDALFAPLRAPLADFARAHPGLLLEDKGQSLALHFRKAPACASDAEALLSKLISAGGSSLELKRGKMVLEVTPGNADKGTAIAAFLQEPPFAGRRPVFIGDDVTDEDGFAVVNAHGGLAIRVGHDPAPTAARHRLLDEAAVIAWLLRWADGAADGERR